ncbi:MAG: GMC family oxidoreductase [Candidatus Babeliales bacterium]
MNTAFLKQLTFSLMITSLLISPFTFTEPQETRSCKQNLCCKESADFVIVGAGIGGCVLAGRLTENPNFSVCLLEAGQDAKDPLIPFPVFWTNLYFNAEHDWSFWTKPLENTNPNETAVSRLFAWPRGKMLGGSTNHYAVQWSWGSKFVYDNWKNNLGLTQWGYQEILPFLQKAEHVFGLLDGQEPSDCRGFEGPIPVRETNIQKPIHNEFLDFSRASLSDGGLGLATFSDIQFATEPGFAWGQNTVTELRTRVSAYDAYVRPFIATRKNLKVKVGSFVTRILLDKNKKATGVEYIVNGISRKIFARKEVIICGGVVNSPKILMQSGIGPADVLAATTPEPVQLRHDLPGVGKNVCDHIFGQIYYGTNKFPEPISDGPASPFFLSSNFLEMDGFMSLEPETRNCILPPVHGLDFELVPILAPAILVKEIDTFNSFFQGSLPVPAGTAFFINAAYLLTQPKSNGEIVIFSNNPLDPPYIIPPYFTEEQDVTDLRNAFKKSREVMEKFTTWLETSTTNTEGIQITGEVFPGPNIQADAQIDLFNKSFATPSTHQVGGCKMGANNDPLAVVDQEFRVFGIRNLRVVDGSVLPTTTVTRPSATIYAMSERAADIIKQTHSH